MGPRRGVTKELKRSQYWADVVFLEWESQADALPVSTKGLIQQVFRVQIVNPRTLAAMYRALASRGLTISPPWPGEDFDTSTDEGRALLATENARTVAWFPVRHKKALGEKVIHKITLFQESTKRTSQSDAKGEHMILHVRPR